MIRADPLPATTRYRAVVAYDGTRFQGFQRQAGETPTVQAALEAAIERVTGQRVTLKAAGRTDTGVHATGQVIAFDVMWRHTPADLWRALNANLPPDVALSSLEEAPPGFHPRYDARSRVYEYTLYVAPARHPLLDRYAWHVPVSQALNNEIMQRAADLLVGTHDFAAFGQPPQGENTVRQVFCSQVQMLPPPPPVTQLLRYRIEANGFLYHMVRRIVGALVRVGSGALSLDEMARVLQSAPGNWPNQAAPARGLCLIAVTYE
ncbi:MAG: tRNA pseudouridine(38-40) synthase TruA [Anaerolineae bacterium]